MKDLSLKRNHSIDLLKFICAVFVVLLHCDWEYRGWFSPLTRCAVPCFFMISGYLLYNLGGGFNVSKIKSNLNKILKITVFSTLLFFLWDGLLFIFTNRDFTFLSVRQLINWLCFNECPFAYHLWYLYAYIYVLIIVFIFEKLQRLKVLFYITPLLLLCDLLFGYYGNLIFGISLPVYCLRNFLFVGMPYFLLGAILGKYNNRIKLHRSVLIGMLITFIITSYLECYVLNIFDILSTRKHYLSSTFLAVSLFLLIIDLRISKENFITKLGCQDSLYIYVFHPIILTICTVVSVRIGWDNWYRDVAPVLILCFTFLLIYMLRLLKIIK